MYIVTFSFWQEIFAKLAQLLVFELAQEYIDIAPEYNLTNSAVELKIILWS